MRRDRRPQPLQRIAAERQDLLLAAALAGVVVGSVVVVVVGGTVDVVLGRVVLVVGAMLVVVVAGGSVDVVVMLVRQAGGPSGTVRRSCTTKSPPALSLAWFPAFTRSAAVAIG